MKVKLLVLLSIWLIGGCADREPDSAGTPAATAAGPFSKAFVLEQLKPGMDREQVRKLYGSGYREVQEAKDGTTKLWRYDDKSDPAYQVADTCCDDVDVEALENNKLKAQLFIRWDGQGKLAGYTLVYIEPKAKGGYRILSYRSEGKEDLIKEG